MIDKGKVPSREKNDKGILAVAKRIDHKRVVAMRETGINIKNIAQRLRCSEKQVSRILGKNKYEVCEPIDRLLNSETEYVLWRWYFFLYGSYEKVAYRFGVSKQAIWEKLNQKKEFINE